MPLSQKIFFTSPAHKARFLEAIEQLGKSDGAVLDSEYSSMLYILTADLDTWEQVSAYVSRSGINIQLMLQKGHFSSGYLTLIRLAANLFNGRMSVDPREFTQLDEINFQVVLTALVLRRGGLRLNDFQEQESEEQAYDSK